MYAIKRDAHHRITSSDVAYPTVFAAAHALLGIHPAVLAVFVDAAAGASGELRVVLGASASASAFASASASASASGIVVCKLRRTFDGSDGIVKEITRTSQVLAAQPLPFLHDDAMLTLRDYDAALRRATRPPKRAAFECAMQAIREEQANEAEGSDSDSDSEYVPPYSDGESESESNSDSDTSEDSGGVDDNDVTFLP